MLKTRFESFVRKAVSRAFRKIERAHGLMLRSRRLKLILRLIEFLIGIHFAFK